MVNRQYGIVFLLLNTHKLNIYDTCFVSVNISRKCDKIRLDLLYHIVKTNQLSEFFNEKNRHCCTI